MEQRSGDDSLVTTFSTAAFRENEATTAWREMFGRTLLRIDITPLSDRFRAEARAQCWSGFGIIHASTTAAHQANSRALIANDDVSFGKISFLPGQDDQWFASQLGRTAELFAGDGVLMSNGDVGSITLPTDCHYTTFSIPAFALKSLVPDIETWFARRVPGSSHEMRMLSGYLDLARDERALATPALQNAFATHVVDLLALCVGAGRDAAVFAGARGGRAARLHAMKRDIQEALGRSDLSVRMIAARHSVSPRYVQKLFDDSGTTFTRYVLEQRLGTVHRVLNNRARTKLPVSMIAYEAGFTDLSHFNRAFRKRFGCTPSDVRHAVNTPDRSRADRLPAIAT